jgi:hypothetical protein
MVSPRTPPGNRGSQGKDQRCHCKIQGGTNDMRYNRGNLLFVSTYLHHIYIEGRLFYVPVAVSPFEIQT